MKPRKANYLIHRWLGLIVSVQLLAWSAGGFVFSVFDIENVRGERDVASAPFEPLDPSVSVDLPAHIRSTVERLTSSHPDIAVVTLVDRGIGPAWEIRTTTGRLIARLDHESGEIQPLISEEDAVAVAQRDFAHAAPIDRIELIQANPPVEYRSGVLPAYRVEFDHQKHPRIYVDARNGEVVARRNQIWRIFDFFWMLHTMDYQGRDNFNHPLLTIFSVLAILTSGSGVALWAWRAKSSLSRRWARIVQRT